MTGETACVVKAPFGVVGSDVIAVSLPKLLDGIFNRSESRCARQKCDTTTSKTQMLTRLTLVRHLPSSPLC